MSQRLNKVKTSPQKVFILLCMTVLVYAIFRNTVKEKYMKSTDLQKLQQAEIGRHTVLQTNTISTLDLPEDIKTPLFGDIKGKFQKQNTFLFVGIFSFYLYTDRRDTIRKTWLKDCYIEERSICRFLLDGLDQYGNSINEVVKSNITNESYVNMQDTLLLDTFAGFNFGYRMYYSFIWVMENFDFSFFLRIDDDQYLCLDRLLYELPFRKEQNLYWGYQHCNKGVERIDEGLMILGADLIKEFVARQDSLMCQKTGGQTIALWVYELAKIMDITWFGDPRIFHKPAVSTVMESFLNRTEICQTYLSLHGAYSLEMLQLHDIYLKDMKHNVVAFKNYSIKEVRDKCPNRSLTFNYNAFKYSSVYAVPRLCNTKPTWSTGRFAGREKKKV